MKRDIEDTGEIFEPKTVETSFCINCDSTMAHLFAIDLDNSELIWLNIGRESNSIVSGQTDNSVLLDYFNLAKVINVKKFFSLMATEIVTNKDEADVIVGDKIEQVKEDVEVIHSWDFEKMLAYLNS